MRLINDAKWANLVSEIMDHRNQLETRNQDTLLAILAGESAIVFGQRAEFTITWPDGAPLRKTDAEFRQWAANELARLRAVADG